MVQSKYPFQLGIIAVIVGLLVGSNYIMRPAAAQSPSGIVVDHNSVALFEEIPDQYIQAASSMDMLFIDRSVGANISDGLSCLNYASDEVAPNHCKRYEHVDPTFSVNPSEVDWSRAGGFDRTNWDYMTWATGCDSWSDKLNCFFDSVDPLINQYDVVSFQYSYLLVDEGSTIANQPGGFFSDNPGLNDVYDLEAYEANHADKEFIYWTTSLARPIGTSVSESFNDQMRQYAATHNKILFDVADILSHDPDGNPCYDSRDGVPYDNGNSSENYPTDGLNIPAICQHYTTEVDGGHLGNVSAGKIRVAKAFWVLMAQIAGWSPANNPPAPELSLTGILIDEAIYLNWTVVNSSSLPDTATWQIEYSDPVNGPYPPITGLSSATRSYTLGPLSNNVQHTVTLNAMDDGTPILSDTTTAFPANHFVYLPMVLK